MPIYLWGPPAPHAPAVPVPFLPRSGPDVESLPLPFSLDMSRLAPTAAAVGLDFDSLNVFEFTHGPIPADFDNWKLSRWFVMPALHFVEFDSPCVPPDELQDWCHIEIPVLWEDWELL